MYKNTLDFPGLVVVGAVDLARSWMVRPQVWSLGLLG